MDLWGFLGELWKALVTDTGIETLKVLFDGILGASVGALVAVVVLKRTLREQRKGMQEQLAKQDRHHQEQLAAQNRHHEAQLAKQDAALITQVSSQQILDETNRTHNTASDLLTALNSVLRIMTDDAQDKTFPQLGLELHTCLHRLYFGLQDEHIGLYETLKTWLPALVQRAEQLKTIWAELQREVKDLDGEATPDSADQTEVAKDLKERFPHDRFYGVTEGMTSITNQCAWLASSISSFVRTGNEGKTEVMHAVQSAWEVASTGDNDAWLSTYAPDLPRGPWSTVET